MVSALMFTVPAPVYATHIRLTSQVFIPSSIRGQVPHFVRCIKLNPKTLDEKIVRKSANNQRPVWDDNYVQSLNSKYTGDTYITRATRLKKDVKKILEEVVDSLDGLQMIDDLQRLGVCYHFMDEINRVLENIYNNLDASEDDLHATSLKFRLLRQHGYNVSQEVFDNFMIEKGHFKPSLCEDTRGMLQLYEASFLSFSDESILEKAQDFVIENLREYLQREDIDQDLASLINHALELPLHWRVPRLEARWFIDLYERRSIMNPTLLQFAKLDFNMVQATHQKELKHLSRWWNKNGLGKKLSFGRGDRFMENFLISVLTNFKPEFSNYRRNITTSFVLALPIDDLCDAYGTVDEVEAFANAVERWDIGAIEQLPNYCTKICFLALFNLINEMGYDNLKEQGVNSIPHIQKSWADWCKASLKSTKWKYSGYTPTLEEYVDNGWILIGAYATLMHACFSFSNPLEGLEWLLKFPNIVRSMGIIARFTNDLATSSREMKIGGSPTSIQCYMHESGASEEDSRDHIKYLIRKTWKKMNEEQFTDSPFHQTLVEITVNAARVTMWLYQYRDGLSDQVPETTKQLLSMLINPVPLEY